MALVNGVEVLLPPPEGYVVDFENPTRTAVPLAYWVAGVGIFLSLLFMGQRLYTKLFLMRTIQVEDSKY